MTAARRWLCVGIGVVLLVTTPILVRALPVPDESVDAVTLLHRIQGSEGVAFTGHAESLGAMGLPDDDDLSSVAKLLGQRTRLGVWWRGPDEWRVATLRTTGETDLFHSVGRTTRWVYESKHVTVTPVLPVRLPNSYDVLPNVLARRVLAGAQPGEVSRLPAVRVAGRAAVGLRLTPSDQQSSIGHVDVFADAQTGLPLRVVLYGRVLRSPALSAWFDDVSLEQPASGDTKFTPPPNARVSYDDVIDIASAADRFADRVPPATLAGLSPRGDAGFGSVGVYGRGPTVMVAIPIWDRYAGHLREQIEKRPGTRVLESGLLVSSAPLNLLLADAEPDGDSWLLAGTVTRHALVAAAEELSADPPSRR